MKPTPDSDTTLRSGRVPRLYVDAALDGRDFVLPDRQAHYLRKVLRLKPGHAIVVFDGRGAEYVATVIRLTRDGATLHPTAAAEPVPESLLDLRLLQAIAKADAMDLVVQKATELGVRAITPITTEFGVVKLDEARAQQRVGHWRRVAQSACEQCGRHSPTRIEAPRSLAACLAELVPDSTRLVLDPLAQRAYRDLPRPRGSSGPLYLLVGPEGGFSDRDLLAVDRAGFANVRLGPRVMRVETAAITACALAQAHWGDLG